MAILINDQEQERSRDIFVHEDSLLFYDDIFPWSGLSASSSSWCSWSCSSSSTPTTRRWWARSRPSTPRSFPLPCRQPPLGQPPGKINRIAVKKPLGSKLWSSSAQILDIWNALKQRSHHINQGRSGNPASTAANKDIKHNNIVAILQLPSACLGPMAPCHPSLCLWKAIPGAELFLRKSLFD